MKYFSDSIENKLIYLKYKFLSIKYNADLILNKSLKKFHNNKRIFILGNGPSIKNIDFSLLENEILFSVNQITRLPFFKDLNIYYHIWADPFFFNLNLSNEYDSELLEIMNKISEAKNKPTCFFPIYQKKFVTKYLKNLDFRFFYPTYRLEGNLNKKINLTSSFPSFFNVVQYAITISIYMGFNEIYLLGCENTSILTSINTRLNNSLNDSYSYNLSSNEKTRMKKISDKITFESELSNNLNIIKDYKLLKLLCIRNNISLVNLTPFSLIEGISKSTLESINFHV